MVARA
jgi:endonuclease III-like uncharacterized protein